MKRKLFPTLISLGFALTGIFYFPTVYGRAYGASASSFAAGSYDYLRYHYEARYDSDTRSSEIQYDRGYLQKYSDLYRAAKLQYSSYDRRYTHRSYQDYAGNDPKQGSSYYTENAHYNLRALENYEPREYALRYEMKSSVGYSERYSVYQYDMSETSSLVSPYGEKISPEAFTGSVSYNSGSQRNQSC